MARKIDKKSTRQKVFGYLEKHTKQPRSFVVEKVMVDFGIGKSYAMTLYQSHRAQSKKSGHLTEVFTIRDMKEGKAVDPYMSSMHTPNPVKNDATSKKLALKKYEKDLTTRITKAKKL